MPGRHTTTKRPSRAGPILAAIVAVAVIVALGIYLAPRLTEQSDASGCEEPERVSVAAPRDLTPAIRAAVTAMAEPDACVTLTVSTVYPESSLAQIDQSLNSTPTIWILDSRIRLGELSPEVRGQLEPIGSAATTPIVLGASVNASDTPPPTWRAAFEDGDFVLPDPATAPAGAFAIAALSAEREGADIEPVLEEVAARQAEDDLPVPDTDVLIRESRRQFGPRRWFPVTEQEYIAWRMLRVNWDLTAMLPESGTIVLDYPIVTRTEWESASKVARELAEFLTETGSSALGDFGFRGPDGSLINAASLPGLKALRPPIDLNQLITAWSDAQAAAVG
jgi:Bacterial extracellular solute-binding protein